MKKIAMIIIGTFAAFGGIGQSITQSTIGSMGGQFKNGNVYLSFTIGETFVGSQASGQVQLGTGFWAIVPASYVPAAAIVYRFTGNGSFFLTENWQGGQIPPNPLPAGAEILIEPVGTGECILNAPYTVSPKAKFSIVAGKRFSIAGSLRVEKQ